jgi:hypothetical protein
MLTFALLVAAAWLATRWWTLIVAPGWTLHAGTLEWFKATSPPSAAVIPPVVRTPTLRFVPAGSRSIKWWLNPDDLASLDARGFGLHIRFAPGSPPVCIGHIVVLWPLPLVLGGGGTMLLRSGIIARRRAITGLCRACGYDRAGLAASSVCPECGKG